jgi:hypothetical protein
MQDSKNALEQRLRTTRFLKKHFGCYHALTQKLAHCEPFNRCMSGACAECTRATQRWLVAEASKLSDYRNPDAVCSSWIIGISAKGKLSKESLSTFQAKIKSVLNTTVTSFALGGVDFSFNTGHEKTPDHWAIQLWFLTLGEEWDLGNRLIRNAVVKRPLKKYPFDGNPKAVAYSFKNKFSLRESYREIDLNGRKTSNTRNLPLRVSEKKELLPFLDREGLHSRLFLIGVRPTKTRDGVRLIRLPKKQNSELAQHDG